METATNDVDLLREEIATLRKEMDVLRAQAPAAPAVAKSATAADEEVPQSNRRGFLKLAGAAAAGATVAAVAGSTQQVAALTGGNMLIGVVNSATLVNETTGLQNPSTVSLDDQTFRVNNYSTGSIGIPTTHRVAGAFTVSGPDASLATSFRTGVYARTSGPAAVGGQGVFGSHEGADNPFASGFSFGVVGTTEAGGYGVLGYNPTGTNSVGVLGRADAGIGVIASSFTGVSLLVRDGGRLQQALRATGAPAAGSFTVGEQIRDGVGDMYICTASGTPGTWRKVTAQAPGYANAGGSINLLAQPIRLLDTRPSTTAPLNNGFVKVPGNTTLTLQITGTVASGLSVPAGAKGILGNLTIIGPSGEGYAQVWPSGAAPTTSNINYGPVNASPALANYLISALDATGKINVLTYATAHVLLDVSGFVF